MINSYVALDLETTGLDPMHNEIIEIGAVKVEDNKIVDTYQTLVYCQGPLTTQITTLTGITPQMVSEGIALEEALHEIKEFCKNYILLGHNIQFDFSFLKAKAVACKLTFSSLGIDTLKIARKVLPDLEKRSLEFLSAYYQIPVNASHRALDDARTAMGLYQIFQNEFGDHEELFIPRKLQYKVKKQSPITAAQKGYLNDLLEYHKIDFDKKIEELTKSEASRIIDEIIRDYGRILRYRSS